MVSPETSCLKNTEVTNPRYGPQGAVHRFLLLTTLSKPLVLNGVDVTFLATDALPAIRGVVWPRKTRLSRAGFLCGPFREPKNAPGWKVGIRRGVRKLGGGRCLWAYGGRMFLGKLFSMEVLDKKDVSCNFLRKATKGVQPIAPWIQVVGDGDHVHIMALRRLG
jgi:hypothetical protein